MGLFGFKSPKGPKEHISKAIASNLGTYFEVDQKKIESKLLSDARIVLHDVRLKEQRKVIRKFGDLETGRSSVVHVTGKVDKVIFSWKWSVPGPDSPAWVKKATLTIRGLSFKANLSWWDNKTVKETLHADEPASSKSTTPNKTSSKNALRQYIKQQLAMIVDSLKLQIEDYKFIVEALAEDGVKGSRSTSVVIGGKAVDIISMGRRKQFEERGGVTGTKRSVGKPDIETVCENTSQLPLEQIFVMESLSVMLHTYDSEPQAILEDFSYKARAVRLTGERFLTGTGTGLVVKGDPPADGKLSFHAGRKQIQAMTELSKFVLAPTGESGTDDAATSTKHEISEGIEVSLEKFQAVDSIVSSFELPLNSVSLHLDSSDLVVSSFVFRYHADGTLAEITADRLEVDSSGDIPQDKLYFATLGVRARLRPSIFLELDAVESLCVPGVIQLTEPTKNVSFHFKNGTVFIRSDSIDAQRLKSRDKSKSSGKDTGQKKPNWKAALTLPVNICANEIRIANAYNIKKKTEFRGLELDMAPGIDVAIVLQRAYNELYDVENIALTASIPIDREGVIENLHVAAANAVLTAGRSSNEWESRLDRKKDSVNYQLPYAHIEPLNLDVSYEGAVSTKNNKLVTRSFHGNESTTQKDLVRHYKGNILLKWPGFITNAEVLGMSFLDLTATTLGPMGALAGIAGVDAVKGTIAAGKRSRKVSATDDFHASDIFRGIVQVAKEATKAGAVKRGKKAGQGGVIDWAYGAAESTHAYAKENKSRFCAAGVGGAVVTAVALGTGPIALPLAVGLLATTKAGEALDRARRSRKKAEETGSAREKTDQ